MSDLSKFQNIIKSSNKRKKRKETDIEQIANKLDLSIMENEYGTYFHKMYNYELDIRDTLKGVNYLDEKLFNHTIKKKDLVFLDLETTSLSIGAGNYPFLIGIGFFKDSEFILKQYLFTDVDSERAILEKIKEVVKDRIIVTYNGKCFDIPLLENRFLINNIKQNIQKPSLDLLYLMRRVFKHYLNSFDLQTVSDYLSIDRNKWEDVEGYEIPRIYNEYIHYGRYEKLKPVLYHNERDVFSLARMIYFIEYDLYRKRKFNNKYILAGVLDYEIKTQNYKIIKDIKYSKIKKNKNINYLLLKKLYLYHKKRKEWKSAEKILNWSLEVFSGNSYFIKELTKVYYLRLKNYSEAVTIAKKGYRISSKFGLDKQKKYFKKIIDRYS